MQSSGFPQTSQAIDDEEDGVYGEYSSTSRRLYQESHRIGGSDSSREHQLTHILEREPVKDIPYFSTRYDHVYGEPSSANSPPDGRPDCPIGSNDLYDHIPHPEEYYTPTPEIRPAVPDSAKESGEPDELSLRGGSFVTFANPEDASQVPDERSPVEILLKALLDPAKSNQYVFRLYRDIPSPGVAQLGKKHRNKLLHRFADPMNRRWPDARRFLRLLEDMIEAKLPMRRSLWTSAIHLAGRARGKVKKSDLVRAIGIWKHMERITQHQSDDVIFTILFDISIKAGQFSVAERLLDEMKNRGIGFTRFGHVSKIYYHGLMDDADGIRQSFSEFVAAGNLVDTVVLNCLMASFARIDDIRTVMHLYDTMMEAQRTSAKGASIATAQSPSLSPALTSEMTFYRKKSKGLGRQLKSLASLKDESPEKHRAVQEALPMTPDTRTFHILLYHYACRWGNFERFMSIIEDMERIYTVPPRGMIYKLLFQGFSIHAGKRKHWSVERLRQAWEAYLRALYESKTRHRERLNHRTQRLVWENPFTSTVSTTMGMRGSSFTAARRIPTELYIPLPLNAADASNSPSQVQKDNAPDEDNEETEESVTDTGHLDADELFGNYAQSRDAEEEVAELDRLIENGVFISRDMIVLILRAFGACCEPKEVLDVWFTLERIWRPEQRRILDVQVVKEEIEKQVLKSKRLSQMRWRQ